jgi:hypothetical protein
MRHLRLIWALTVATIVLLAALTGLAVLATGDKSPALWPILLVGVLALAAFLAGMGVVEKYSAQAKQATSFEAAAVLYRTGCGIAVAANAASVVVTVIVLFANGVNKDLLLPCLLVVALHLIALAMAMPRMKTLRKLHHPLKLPFARI